MYQTVLRSVNGYTAIGANGEKLQFVGNWYGKVGEIVWTDGNIIFGHSPLRASSTMTIFPTNSGIPVLCNNLRGYFSPAGTWSAYDVVQKDWIVNNENYFFSGTGSNVKAASISDKGDLYLVSGGEYSQYQQVSKNDRFSWLVPNPNVSATVYLGHINSGWTDYDFWVASSKFNFSDTESYSLGLVGANKQEPLKIYKNNTKISEIDLTPFVENLKEKFSNLKETLPLNLSRWTNDEILTALTLQVQAVNADNGNVEYHVLGCVHGYFYIEVYVSMVNAWTASSLNVPDLSETRVWLPCGISCLYNSKQEILNSHSYGGFKATAQYPTYQLIICDSEESAMIGDTTQDILKNAFGDVEVDLSLETSTSSNDVFFQAGDGYCKLSKYGLASFYDSQSKIIAENVVVDDDYICVEIDSYYTDKLDIFTGFTVSGLELNVKYKIYTPDGRITEKEADLSTLDTDVDADGIPLMDGYYTRDTNGALVPFCFKPLLKKNSDNVYWFGTHGGKLYIKTKSGIQEVGDGLKNFRLEVLNDISKAKG